jgi:hypothetical protein
VSADAFSTAMADELMTSWRAGMCDGLELAAKMADAIIAYDGTSDEQRAALIGLRDALRQSGVGLAAEERTR